MEIIGIVVLVIVVVLIVGSMDNARPVSSWSDEKLLRMYGKLLNASTVNNRAGNHEQANEHFKKAEEVKEEIESRRKKLLTQGVEQLADALAPAIRNTAQLASAAIEKVMTEQKVNVDQARAILGSRLKEAHAKYTSQGMNDEKAGEAAMKEVFGN